MAIMWYAFLIAERLNSGLPKASNAFIVDFDNLWVGSGVGFAERGSVDAG